MVSLGKQCTAWTAKSKISQVAMGIEIEFRRMVIATKLKVPSVAFEMKVEIQRRTMEMGDNGNDT